MEFIAGLTDEQKRRAGLLPEQQQVRFSRQLQVLKRLPQSREGSELQAALCAALDRMAFPPKPKS